MPAGWRVIVARVRGLFARRVDPGFDVEMREHLDLLKQRYVDHGMTNEEAERAARRQFGNLTSLQEQRQMMRTIPTLESLWSDCRQAARMLRTNPTFALTIVLTLALGIGANTAIFSICNTVLLKPLPYADPDRIVMLWEQLPGNDSVGVAPANFVDMRRQLHAFSEVAAINPFPSFVFNGGVEPVRLPAAGVSWNFFRLLGTPVALGRSFLEEEDQPGRDRVAILTHTAWTQHFGGGPDIIGRAVALNDVSYTIVGVLPRDFEFVGRASDFQSRNRYELFVPLALAIQPSRGTHPLRVFARVKSGATMAQAQADASVVAANLAQAYPNDNKGRGIRVVPLHQQLTAELRPVLLTLLGAVAFVLSIACANVANLLITRGISRHRETSVRLAIGASRGRIAQQLLVESMVLSLAGGAVGLMLAVAMTRVAGAYLPGDLSRAANVAIDWRVLAFTSVISLGTGILFGMAPWFQAQRVGPHESLKQGLRVAGGMHTRLRNSLVVAQIAITLILLVGAGLMAKSLWMLLHVPIGFNSANVLTARLTLPRARYEDAGKVAAFQRELLERLRSIPGVQSAGAATYLPLTGEDNGWAFRIEGRPPEPPGVFTMAKYRPVGDGFFETLGMPVLRGRAIAADDNERAPWVVVINRSMARAHWGERNPVGERLRFGGPHWRTVIGVVGDVRHEGLDGDPKAEMYVPFGQAPNVETGPTMVVRSAVDPVSVTASLRMAVAAIDKSVPVDRVRTMDEIVTGAAGQPRFRTLLLAVLSFMALAMASVGIYGVTNYAVVQRTREFGIYLAVGATGSDLVRLVLGRAAVIALTGVGLGVLASVALVRAIADLLYDVPPLDPLTFAVVSLLLFTVACLASFIPARRATRIDPMIALRYE